jgi:L,D-transpeptidase catalytic domain
MPVCDVVFGEDEAKPESDAPAASMGQPLTRKDCALAGMQSDDSAKVCEEKLEGEAAQVDAKTTPVASTILINIDKDAQKMTVSVDGEERYHWPVSTGRVGYSTPSGTFTARSMNKIWYSKQWDNAPMPHAIFFTGDGHAIHGTNEVKRLGKPASHGCVRLSPQNAATLYTLVAETGLENTQVVLAGVAPGRSGQTASQARSHKSTKSSATARSLRYKSQYTLAPPGNEPTARSKKRKGGLFRNLFGRH